MKREEATDWLRDLSAGPPYQSSHRGQTRPRVKWLIETQHALESLFPAGHVIRAQWDTFLRGKHPAEIVTIDDMLEELAGVVAAALSIYEGNRLNKMVSAIRAETVDELLVQADALLDADHVVAATVVAGGALETNLHFLCTNRQLSWKGPGGINAYSTALTGADVLSKTDGKAILHWAGLRNDAAHTPATFASAPDVVRRTIEAIRQFIGHYPE